MQTALYAILHMFVDGVCALAMFGWFAEGSEGYFNILLYNFCAFALQMPLGTMLDLQATKRMPGKSVVSLQAKGQWTERLPYVYAAAGVVLTIIGALTHPVFLGIGNALFHVGGGVDVIREDFANHWKGRALGVFVAPGALGLYVGSLVAKSDLLIRRGMIVILLGGIMFVVLALLALLLRTVKSKGNLATVDGYVECKSERGRCRGGNLEHGRMQVLILPVCCLLVVILRSYVGMAVSFPWKTTVMMGFLSVFAVVLGKMAGGFLAASLGMRKVMVFSLVVSAACFLLCKYAVFGIAAQFFFNMTMPVTLYMLVEHYRRLAGFAFGLLTFGLFLGFLPAYLEPGLQVPGAVTGCVGSLVSLILLFAALSFGQVKRDS